MNELARYQLEGVVRADASIVSPGEGQSTSPPILAPRGVALNGENTIGRGVVAERILRETVGRGTVTCDPAVKGAALRIEGGAARKEVPGRRARRARPLSGIAVGGERRGHVTSRATYTPRGAHADGRTRLLCRARAAAMGRLFPHGFRCARRGGAEHDGTPFTRRLGEDWWSSATEGRVGVLARIARTAAHAGGERERACAAFITAGKWTSRETSSRWPRSPPPAGCAAR